MHKNTFRLRWLEDYLVKTYLLMQKGVHDLLLCGKHRLQTGRHTISPLKMYREKCRRVFTSQESS